MFPENHRVYPIMRWPIPVEHHRLGHALEFMAAAHLGHEKAGDLPLHPCGHDDTPRFAQCLSPRCDIGHVAEYLACGVNHYRPGFDREARSEHRLASALGKDRDGDAVLRKCARVLGQAEPCEPIGYFLHRRPRPAEFGLVDPGRAILRRAKSTRTVRRRGDGGQPEEPQTEAGPEYAAAGG
jgi:hypothetical protein